MITSAPPAGPSRAFSICVHLRSSVVSPAAVLHPSRLQARDTKSPQSTSLRRLPTSIRRLEDSVSGLRSFQGDAVGRLETIPDTPAAPAPSPGACPQPLASSPFRLFDSSTLRLSPSLSERLKLSPRRPPLVAARVTRQAVAQINANALLPAAAVGEVAGMGSGSGGGERSGG